MGLPGRGIDFPEWRWLGSGWFWEGWGEEQGCGQITRQSEADDDAHARPSESVLLTWSVGCTRKVDR